MERPDGSDDARRAQRAELLAAFDSQMRGRLSMRLPDGAHDEEAGPVVRSWGWAPRGLVLYRDLSRLDGAQLDALIERQVDFFGALELAFEWKTYAHDRTDDLTGARVRSRGAREPPDRTGPRNESRAEAAP